MAHTETMLESKEIFNGRVIRVTVDKVQLEDGTTSTREIVHHHGGACILPYFADGTICMVRQFRYAMQQQLWELPAGKLEKAYQMVMSGEIKDGKTIAGILKLKALLAEGKL